MPSPAIIIENAVKTFSRAEPVLEGISLRVDEGELVALSGPSGSSKSTLIRLICGLEVIDASDDARVDAPGSTTQRLRPRPPPHHSCTHIWREWPRLFSIALPSTDGFPRSDTCRFHWKGATR